MRVWAAITFDHRMASTTREAEVGEFGAVRRTRRGVRLARCVVAMGPRVRRDLRRSPVLVCAAGVSRAARNSGPRGWCGAAVAGRGLLPRGTTVLLLDAGVDLFAMHLHLGRSFDPELHLTRADFEHGDLHRVSDPDVLA